MAGQTVLIVEDDPLVRLTVQHYLSGGGYCVLEAESSDEAVRVAEAHEGPLDLLVTDMVLPGMSGHDLSRRLTELRPSLRTVFMSAYPNDMLIEQRRIAPGTPSIEKPFSEETLLAAVRQVLA